VDTCICNTILAKCTVAGKNFGSTGSHRINFGNQKKVDFDDIINPPNEIERKRLLISKFKEGNIDRREIQELIAILEKEKHIAEEEKEKMVCWYLQYRH
jgi:hypothetical protein